MEERRLRSLQSINLDNYFTPENALTVLPHYKVLAFVPVSSTAYYRELTTGTKEIKLLLATKEDASQARPSNISVLLVAVEQECDFESALQASSEFLYCAQKYVFGRGLEQGTKLHAQALELAKALSAEYLDSAEYGSGDQLLARFRQQDSLIIELATTLFREFDRDNSGLIDLSEIREIGSRLGQALSEDDLQVIMKDIDTDGDGKISLEEFGAWWRSGRKGVSKKMKELTSKVSSMAGFLLKYGESFKTVTDQQTLTKVHWDLSFGNVTDIANPGTRVKGQLSVNKARQEMAAQLQQFIDFPVMFMVTFNLRPGVDPTTTALRLSKLLKSQMFKLLCSVVDSKLVLVFILKEDRVERVKNSYESTQTMASAPVEQRFDFEIQIGKSPQVIIEDLRRSPLEKMMDDMLLKLQCDLWSFYRPILRSLIETISGDINPVLEMLLACSVKLHLKMNPFTALPAWILGKLNAKLAYAFEDKNRFVKGGKFRSKKAQALHEAVVTDEVQFFGRSFDVLLDLTIEAPGFGDMVTQEQPSLDD